MQLVLKALMHETSRYIVAEGWVSPRDFLLGLAIIQAFPGPNFNCKHSLPLCRPGPFPIRPVSIPVQIALLFT